jgi:hypothetical protein
MKTYERDLDNRSRIRTERSDSVRATSRRPFVSHDPELLHQRGYIFPVGDSTSYNAPDADLLLSEGFVQDHCFEIAAPGADDPPGMIGLKFEPTRSRRVPEIGGVLWLDRVTAELRLLEFGYRNADLPPEAQHAGGRVRFGRLPNGGWIVDDWSIRMPTLGRRLTLRGGRDTVIGFREAGGSARPAGSTPVDPRTIGLTGVVTDSTTGTPLSGIQVSIQAGAYADTTDESGRYRIRAPATGHYAVTFAHPVLRFAGLDSAVRGARLERGREDSVDVALPLAPHAIAIACAGQDRMAELGFVFGRVVDSVTGAPLADATVSISSGPTRLVAGSVVISSRTREFETRTDRDGFFGACAPSPAAGIKVTARVPPNRVGTRVAKSEHGQLLNLEVRVPD